MTGSAPNHALEQSDGFSCDSDSDETVVLKDSDAFEQCENGLSFVRFMSLEGNTTTDSDLVTVERGETASKLKIEPLPSGLSFLQSHPQFFTPSIPPGSFMFTDCRLQIAMDEQKSHQVVENATNFSALAPSSSEASTCSPGNFIEIAPKPISLVSPTPTSPPAQTLPPQLAPLSDKSSDFKYPKPPIQSSDLRCKNREAARKCRAKRKNFVQQLEHDFKELKEKYAAIQQENDDLRRFIFHHFGVSLTPKPSGGKTSTMAMLPSTLAPATQTISAAQPILLRVVQPQTQQQLLPSTDATVASEKGPA